MAQHPEDEAAVEEERVARLLAIGRRCADRVPLPRRADDHDALLYDDLGLPR